MRVVMVVVVVVVCVCLVVVVVVVVVVVCVCVCGELVHEYGQLPRVHNVDHLFRGHFCPSTRRVGRSLQQISLCIFRAIGVLEKRKRYYLTLHEGSSLRLS